MAYLQISEDKRHALNEERLLKMSPSVRPNIRAVLEEMERRGFRPIMDSGVYRTPAEQAEKVKLGYSTVYYSYHNVTDEGNKPASLAADIVDVRWGWDAGREYWLNLYDCAITYDLTTGVLWGLSIFQRNAIKQAVAKKDFSAKVALGWDEAHCEPTGISIAQAKKGKRPVLKAPLLVAPKPPIRVFLNGKELERATWKAPGYWEVRYGEIATIMGRNVGRGDVAMSIREALEKLGCRLYDVTDNRSKDGKFHMYAASYRPNLHEATA